MPDDIVPEADIGEAMRVGLRRLAKAVVIITSRLEGERFAMAATAVSELSLSPPSLLVCVNQTASIHSPLASGAPFCVNILDSHQEDLAWLCSGRVKGEHRFSQGEWAEAESGVPLLRGAQASFVCLNDQNFVYGTHRIFIGRVVEVTTHGDVDPLVYVDQRYGVIARPVLRDHLPAKVQD
jgi:flavin reductase (DIM6/NTAB) family NADH-FMN oxidoreductase RutF